MSAAYFQFPLCLLGYGKHEKQRLYAIVDNNLVTYAKKQLGSTKRDAIETAAEVLQVNIGSAAAIVRSWQETNSFVERYELRHGKDARVRIAAQLLWDCLGGRLSYREFSILCALNSILGKATSPKRVTQPSIRVRAAGYKSWHVAAAEGGAEKLYSRYQVIRTLVRLEARGFFARARIGGRSVLFKTGVSYEQLCDQIVEAKTRTKLNRSEKDRILRERIKALKTAHINSSAHINSERDTESDESKTVKTRTLGAHSCAHEPALEPAHVNNSSLIEALNESSLNESVLNGDYVSLLNKESQKAVLEERRYKAQGYFANLQPRRSQSPLRWQQRTGVRTTMKTTKTKRTP
jgi:hypothetical protein